MTGSISADEISIDDFEIERGEEKKVSVMLNNPDSSYIMVEFYLRLPEGIDIATDKDDEMIYALNGSRTTRSHYLEMTKQENGNYHVLLYSTRNEAFKGNSGELFNMTLKADSDIVINTYQGKIFKFVAATKKKYEVNFNDTTFNISIKKLEQTVSIEEMPSLTYGDEPYSLPSYTEEELPLTWTSSDDNVAAVADGKLTVTGAGTAVITVSQEGNETYNAFSKEYALTVSKAQLTITANNNSKTAGEANPEFTVSYAGFVNGEDESVLTKAPTVTTTATETSVAGEYPITPADAVAANYEITYVEGILTVIKADQTVSLAELPAMTYGDATYSLPVSTDGGQTLSWTTDNESVAVVEDNMLKTTGAGTATVTATQEGDASHNPFCQSFTLTVNKASLTITADNKTKTAGDANPELTVTYEGFVNGDDESVLTKKPVITTTANAESVAGDYPITPADAVSANYEITYVDGILTVIKADQTVSLTELPQMTYGDADYLLPAATENGQPLTWTSDNNKVAVVEGNTLSLKGAGTATITAVQEGDASHNPFSQTFTLTIAKANLTITAEDKTKTAGEANPELTLTYEGFVNGDNESALTEIPQITCDADVNSQAGEYEIVLSGGSADNYEMTLVNGVLTVEEPPHIRGDVNEDGKVNISDVVATINQMAGQANWRYADVNEDGKVNISDIVAIINIMAGT